MFTSKLLSQEGENRPLEEKHEHGRETTTNSPINRLL